MEINHEDLWHKTATTIVSAGMIPIIIGETIIDLLKDILDEEQAEFIASTFDKPSLNLDQLQEKSGWEKDRILAMLEQLMSNGVVVKSESRRTGISVYRLLGPYPGLFEYTNLRGETTEKTKRLAKKFEKLMLEIREFTQTHYDLYVTEAKKFPPVVRVVPIEQEVEPEAGDKILPLEAVSAIVDKFDDITVAHCYCRHSKDLLDQSCEVTEERLNCLLLGKSAKFAAEYKFGKLISKEEAKEILLKAADEGLVHKAFHIHLNKDYDEEAICNCCKCCCGPMQMYYQGAAPYHCYTSYLAESVEDNCTLCEICVEACPMESIVMEDEAARVIEESCIGCGVCVHQCPDDALSLKRTEIRKVFLPPKKISI